MNLYPPICQGTHTAFVLYLRVLSQLCLSVLLALEYLALRKPSRFQRVAQRKEGMGPITQTHTQSRIKQSGRRRLSGSHTLELPPRRKRNFMLNHKMTFLKYDFSQRVLYSLHPSGIYKNWL